MNLSLVWGLIEKIIIKIINKKILLSFMVCSLRMVSHNKLSTIKPKVMDWIIWIG
jgi:hypothetical protein